MNRRKLLATAGGLAAAVAAAAPGAAAEPPKAVVAAYLAAWNAHDTEAAAALFAADVAFFDITDGNPVVGREAARLAVAAFFRAAPDCRWEMLGDPIVAGDMVAFQWRRAGTNSGDWPDGRPAAHQPFFILGATVMRIDNGAIASQSDYYDALGLSRQLGWL